MGVVRVILLMLVSSFFLSGHAQALSCMRPNPLEEMSRAMARGETPMLMLGTLKTPWFLPWRFGTEAVSVTYRFTGVRLMPDGIDAPMDSEIYVTARCAGEWCASLPKSKDQKLLVVRGDRKRLTLGIGPCAEAIHAAPNDRQIEMLRQCLREGGCGELDKSAYHAE